MAQQFTDRAFESCLVVGLGDATFLGPKFTYVSVPIGDSICLIEALDANQIPNGQWEVVAGVRAANTFTRNTVIASSNANNPVVFSGDSSEITLVVSSEFYKAISSAVNQNTSDIAQNVIDIGNNAGQIAQNVSDISNNAGNINQNAIDIAQNASDISGKEGSLGNPAQDGQGLVSTALGVRSWETLVKYFVDLLDTPASYVGQAGKLLKVNATADGLIFGDPSGTTVSWGSIEGLLSDQIDLQNALNAKLNTDGTAANSLLLQGQNGAFYLDRANQTGIQDLDTISFPNVGVSDLNNLQEAINHAWNAGVILKGGITDNGGCTINIAEYEIVFRVGISDHDQLIALIVPAQIGFIVGAGVSGVIIASYNAGTPIYSLVPSGTEINARTDIALGLVACDGTLVTILSLSTGNTDAMNAVAQRFLDLGLAHIPGGTVLGESGVRNIAITAGGFWLSLQLIPNDAFDSSLTDTFTYWYSDGAGGWISQATQTQISNTLFDDGSGTLAPILNNDYSQSWVYITGNDDGFETHVLYGDLSANTESDVLATSPPSAIPPKLQFLGVLVGRVIVREAIDPFVTVESAFATEYRPGGVTSHNNLAGLQGGEFDDYYHVTQADLAYFDTIPAQLALVQSYVGKNILINGDKSVSQRGDFSTPFPVTVSQYILDRFNLQIPSAGASTAQSKGFSIDAQGHSILYTVTTAANHGDYHEQIVENYIEMAGRTVIYTARVKSNVPVNIYISDGVQNTYSTKHSGGGEWETLTVVKTLSENLTRLKTVISTYDGIVYPSSVGDYFEVGNEQLELGSEFTGFEVVAPATQLAKCQRYYQRFMTNTYILKYSTIQSNNMEIFTFPFPVTMRVNPVTTILTQPSLANCNAILLQANTYQASLKSNVLTDNPYGVDNTGVYEMDAEL